MERTHHTYASIGRRFIAILIDGFILGIFSYFLFGIGESYTVPSFSMSLGPLILTAIYFIVQESSSRKATFGKRVVNIHIETSDGKNLDFLKSSIRFCGKLLSSLLFMIGYIMAFFSQKKLSLHDRLANTIVIKD